MKIAIISFTVNGYQLSEQIAQVLEKNGHRPELFVKSKYLADVSAAYVTGNLQVWAKAQFTEKEAIIFVGAAGIAVRAIAPWVKDKRTDPAVVVLDEQGRFCIPLLAGHIGGANQLTEEICRALNCTAVITTATDVNDRFAVDVFAKKNQLYITDMKLAKEVSAKLLHGETVGFDSELPINGELPEGLCGDVEGAKLGIYIGSRCDRQPFAKTLYLIPRNIVVGIGCRKGIAKESIEELVIQACQANHLFVEAIGQVCSIDLKREEAGIKEYCAQQGIPFHTFTSEELNQVSGTFTPSAFVASITGVDNVCERSAVLGSNSNKLLQKKLGKNGVTVAFAIEDRRIDFE